MTPGPVTRWVLGTAVLGRPAYLNTGSAHALPADRSVGALRARTWQVLDAAVGTGIGWIDTARSYGRAEEFVAQWLLDRAPSPAPFVSSKWGYAYVGGWRRDAEVHEEKEHSLRRLRAQWRESTGLLGEHLGLYQVHSLTEDSPLLTDRPLLAELGALAATGTPVGFSTSGPRQAQTIRRALDLQVDGRRLFSVVQATWNLLEPSAGDALAEASRAGLTVLVKEALANGRLVTQAPPPLAALAGDKGATVDAVALAAAAAQPWANHVLLGPADVTQLQSNLGADKVVLSDADLGRLATLPEPADGYWATRSALPWR